MSADIIHLATRFDFCYVCFYNREDMDVRDAIPLGVMGEVILPRIRGLGLFARTRLAQAELNLLGKVDRRKMEHPFDYLIAELEPIWKKTQPGQAIETLRQSRKPLDISTTDSKDPPKSLLSGTALKRTAAVKQFLNEILEAETLVFLSEPIEPGYLFRPTIRVTASKLSVSVL
jgi:hypothetical protein